VFDAVTEAVHDTSNAPKLFFVDGPGGTGKTYLFNALLTSTRRSGDIALAVASSGTAALLLDGGRTAHSRFNIPLQVDQHSICRITPRSSTAQLIRMAKLIVWDEASMISRHVFDTVSRSFQDIMKMVDPELEQVPFGGKLIVFGGDFRQVLPVLPRGTRAQIVDQCMNRSVFWRHVRTLRLAINMRVQHAQGSSQSADELQQFADYLLRIGDGREPTVDPSMVRLPTDMVLRSTNQADLISAVYGDLLSGDRSPAFLVSRAILTPKNVDITALNEKVLQQFPGEMREFKSADTMAAEEDQIEYPTEFLNSINRSSLPPHSLCLKVGCPIMLLRNINPANGLCNGTRLICRSFQQYVIEAEIATGVNVGNRVFIPHIAITSDASMNSIEFKRTQFPVRLAFAMTINKARGQTFDSIGLYLPVSVFTQWQLYVAMSRVRTPSAIKILVSGRDSNAASNDTDVYTANIVYSEVLQQEVTL